MRRIRWTRTIVFDGPEDHVLRTMASSWIQANMKVVQNRMTAECTEYKVETYETEDAVK